MTTTRPQLPVMSFLTRRELDVASALGAGMSYAEISQMTGLKRETIRRMVKIMVRKLPNGMHHTGSPRDALLEWLHEIGALGTRS